jgi:hypothetical protein
VVEHLVKAVEVLLEHNEVEWTLEVKAEHDSDEGGNYLKHLLAVDHEFCERPMHEHQVFDQGDLLGYQALNHCANLTL